MVCDTMVLRDKELRLPGVKSPYSHIFAHPACHILRVWGFSAPGAKKAKEGSELNCCLYYNAALCGPSIRSQIHQSLRRLTNTDTDIPLANTDIYLAAPLILIICPCMYTRKCAKRGSTNRQPEALERRNPGTRISLIIAYFIELALREIAPL